MNKRAEHSGIEESMTARSVGAATTVELRNARYSDVSDALVKVNLVGTGVLALAGLAISTIHGMWFGVFSALPFAYWLIRLTLTDRRTSSNTVTTLWIAAHAGAIVGTAFLTGGLSSPVTVFIPVMGMVVVALPRSRAVLGLTTALVWVLFVAEIIAGRPPAGLLDVTALSAASILVAVATRRIAGLEIEQRERAVIDHLTGCLNRHALDNRIVELQQQAAVNTGSLAVIAFDLDHFKTINDTHGHTTGDRVLADTSYAVRSQLRRFELLYRTGGEEFLILLPDVDADAATDVAERCRRAVETARTGGVGVTASFGVAHARWPFDADQLIAQADTLLYDAKNSGRNCVRAHDGTATSARELRNEGMTPAERARERSTPSGPSTSRNPARVTTR